MKALTICQPYAYLICLPDDDPRAKRVENRKWSMDFYRGPMLIHAGKSRAFLDLSEDGKRDEIYDIAMSDMPFGALVGICNVVDCFRKADTYQFVQAVNKRPWLGTHQHVEGPYCWVLTECRKFETPIPFRGAQGLFDVPDVVVAEAIEAIDGPPIRCTCGAANDPGSCGHHPACPMKAREG
jgi:activating signal cointegrator 1